MGCMCTAVHAKAAHQDRLSKAAKAASKEKKRKKARAKKEAHAAVSYVPKMIKKSTCGAVGCVSMRSKEACAAAFKALGWKADDSKVTKTNTMPRGCVFHKCKKHSTRIFNKGTPTLVDLSRASKKKQVVCLCPRSKAQQKALKTAHRKALAAEARILDRMNKHKKHGKEGLHKHFAAMEYEQKHQAKRVAATERMFKEAKSTQASKKKSRAEADEIYWKIKKARETFKSTTSKMNARADADEILVKHMKEKNIKLRRLSTYRHKFVYCGLDAAGKKELFAPECTMCQDGFVGWCAGQCTYSFGVGCTAKESMYDFSKNATDSWRKLYPGRGKGVVKLHFAKPKIPIYISEKKEKIKEHKKQEANLRLVKFKDAKLGFFCGNGDDGNTPTYTKTCGDCPDGFDEWCSGDCRKSIYGICEAKPKENDVFAIASNVLYMDADTAITATTDTED